MRGEKERWIETFINMMSSVSTRERWTSVMFTLTWCSLRHLYSCDTERPQITLQRHTERTFTSENPASHLTPLPAYVLSDKNTKITHLPLLLHNSANLLATVAAFNTHF